MTLNDSWRRAYGEVWVAIERNTGRRVAIKYYSHRGGLDWSLLSREVEKLAFLFADRYVVQLLGVGWDAEPPYYIMEYLEPGSLADRLQQGPMPVDKAVELFRDIAVGLVHAHGKGVLHCDLKPANILLDQDNKPRLADFGQSRLSHEQMPALGTMFYMAPEQADLEAMPDARWDVYALGALLYCMLTGHPPHRSGPTVDQFERTPDLKQRLSKYRQMIEQSLPPAEHCKVPGVDALLAEIVDRCLAADPDQRFPNVQSVLDALNNREVRRARRPMMVLGAIGPALLLAVVAWFAWQGFHAALRESNAALIDQALKSSHFTAQLVAQAAGNELERRYQLVEHMAVSDRFREAIKDAMDKPEFKNLAVQLNDPKLSDEERDALREKFRDNQDRKDLQRIFASLIPPMYRPREEEEVASWFFCDAQGLSTGPRPAKPHHRQEFCLEEFLPRRTARLGRILAPGTGKKSEGHHSVGRVPLASHVAMGCGHFHAGIRRFVQEKFPRRGGDDCRGGQACRIAVAPAASSNSLCWSIPAKATTRA